MKHTIERPRRGGFLIWLQITGTLALVASVGAGLYAFVRALDPGTIRLIAGFLLALGAVLVVGALYAGKDVVQAYLVRRQEREDQMRDTERLAQWTRLMHAGSGSSRVNLQLPGGESPLLMPPEFSGAYRDTTLINGKVEIE